MWTHRAFQFRLATFIGLLLLMLVPSAVIPAEDSGPSVVELFTSQGCSSCPPAEDLLTQLGKRSDVIALAYHVTYWDGLGWRDRLGLRESDTRQSQYARALGLSSVYTPQAVINGRVDVVGSDATRLNAQLRRLPPAVIGLQLAAGKLQLSMPALQGGCDCDLLLLGVLPQTQTAVGRGENAGRVIHESNVVRSMTQLGPWNGSAGKQSEPLTSVAQDARVLVLLAQDRTRRAIVAAGKVDMR
jgi:hypothetical protein